MTNSNHKKYSAVAWLICGIGVLFYSYEYLLRIAPSVMEIPLKEHYMLTSGGFGALSAYYYYAYVPMQLPVGLLMDKFGPKRLLTLACLLCAIGTYLFCATGIYWVAAAGRFLVGFGSAFAFVGVLKLATMWLPEDKLAMVAGLAAGLGAVGAMVGDNLLGYLVIHTTWKSTLVGASICGLFLTLLLFIGLRDKKEGSQYPNTYKPQGFSRELSDLKTILCNKRIWVNGAYGCFVYLPTTVLAELWGIPYLEHARNLSAEMASFANSLIFLGFMIGAPIMGWLSDKMHRRVTPMKIGGLGAFLISCGIFFIPSLPTNALLVLLFSLGLFYGSQAIVFVYAREISPTHAAGTAMSVTNMIVMLGGMFLQPLIGYLLDFSMQLRNPEIVHAGLSSEKMMSLYQYSDYQMAFAVIPFGIFIAFVLTFFLKETHAHATYASEPARTHGSFART